MVLWGVAETRNTIDFRPKRIAGISDGRFLTFVVNCINVELLILECEFHFSPHINYIVIFTLFNNSINNIYIYILKTNEFKRLIKD